MNQGLCPEIYVSYSIYIVGFKIPKMVGLCF